MVKMKIGEGKTDSLGVFTIACTCPRGENTSPLIQVQAYDGNKRPAVCAMIYQAAETRSPINLVLPDEEPTVIMAGPLPQLRSAG